MQKTVLAVVPVTFADKDGSGKEVQMWECYIQADDGRLGSLFVRDEVCIGDVVELVTEVRDGKIRLRCKTSVGPISNRA